MEIREVTYLVRVEAEKAKQQMALMDKSFDSMISKTGKLDLGIEKFSNNAIKNLTKTRLSMEAFKKSFASVQNRQNTTSIKTGVESANSNTLSNSLDTTMNKTHQTDTALKSMTYNTIRGFERARMASEGFKTSLTAIKSITNENSKVARVSRVSLNPNSNTAPTSTTLPNSTRLEQSFTGLNARVKDSGAIIDNFSANSIKSINRIKTSVDALKTSLGAIKTQKSVIETPSASKMNTMKKSADNSKVMATNIVGATKSTSRLNKQLTETDRLTKQIRLNTGMIKKDLGSTRQIRLGGGSGGNRRAPEGSGTGVGGGLAYSAQAHPLMSALYRGLGMSTLLHFGGVGAGFLQMGVQQLVKMAQQGIRMAFQTAQEGSEVRKGSIEAQAVSGTFIKNKAMEEGLDPDEVNAVAIKNAERFAQTTAFTKRQALIVQGALVEGGMGTKDSTTEKTIKTVLDRVVAKYNKLDVTESNIQVFTNMLATASTSGKFAKLQFLKQEGEQFKKEFENASPAKRWDMMLKSMEKSSNGLADAVVRSDNSMYASTMQRNRAETALSGRIGRLGMDFETITQSIKTSLIPAMDVVMIMANKMAKNVNEILTPEEELAKQTAIKFKLTEEQMKDVNTSSSIKLANMKLSKYAGASALSYANTGTNTHLTPEVAKYFMKEYAQETDLTKKRQMRETFSANKTQIVEQISDLKRLPETTQSLEAINFLQQQLELAKATQQGMVKTDSELEKLSRDGNLTLEEINQSLTVGLDQLGAKFIQGIATLNRTGRTTAQFQIMNRGFMNEYNSYKIPGNGGDNSL